jgi:toxin ParE1/3/4
VSAAVLTPSARQDLLAAARWIRKDNRAAAIALREALAKAAERIARHPVIGAVRPELLPEPYRFVSLTGFPYVIVYNAVRQPPLIVAVLHTSRDLRPILRDREEK